MQTTLTVHEIFVYCQETIRWPKVEASSGSAIL
jgi:hypothetical protein